MINTTITIGLSDSVTNSQEYNIEKYINILEYVCKSYHVPFTFITADGGYFFDDGKFVKEKSLVLNMTDVDKNTINEIAKDLCAFFHQDKVMISESNIRCYFVSENLSE
jgi:hypothetical protein